MKPTRFFRQSIGLMLASLLLISSLIIGLCISLVELQSELPIIETTFMNSQKMFLNSLLARPLMQPGRLIHGSPVK